MYLHRNHTYSGYGFAFTVRNVSASISSQGHSGCLIHHHGILHSVECDQGTHLLQKKCSIGLISIALTDLTTDLIIWKQLA